MLCTLLKWPLLTPPNNDRRFNGHMYDYDIIHARARWLNTFPPHTHTHLACTRIRVMTNRRFILHNYDVHNTHTHACAYGNIIIVLRHISHAHNGGNACDQLNSHMGCRQRANEREREHTQIICASLGNFGTQTIK